MRHLSWPAATIAFTLLAAAARGQSTGEAELNYFPRPLPDGLSIERTWYRTGQGAKTIGARSIVLGDLDGDGVPEFAVKAFGFSSVATYDIYRGATLALLRTHVGSPLGNDHFGDASSRSDDLDGDGTEDVLIGAPEETVGSLARAGVVRAFSGRTGALLFRIDGTVADQRFGTAIVGLPDIDGDGRAEFAVRDGTVPGRWRFDLYDSSLALDGSLIGTPGGWMHLARVCDLTHDGVDEFVVSRDDPAALLTKVDCFDGSDGSVALSFQCSINDRLGSVVVPIGDVDGDSTQDLACGEPFRAGAWGHWPGAVEIRSGATGARLAQAIPAPNSDGYLGTSLAAVGDWDGDGIPDVAVGQPGANRAADSTSPHGRVCILSGADLSTIDEIDAPRKALVRFGTFGEQLGSLDFDRNGRPDLLVGAIECELWTKLWLSGGSVANASLVTLLRR